MSGYVRREYPEWSWSFSRQQTFLSCQRRYYYNYYRSHNGWEYNAKAEAVLAYRLKKLTNIYLVLGDAVHKVAEQMVPRVLEGRGVLDADVVEEEIRRHLRRVWKSSRDEQELFLKRPNRVDMLHEFYYGLGVSDATIARINQRVKEVSQALVRSPIWELLIAPGTELISCEQFDTFPIGDTPCYAVPDLLFKTQAGQWIIVDWKTGEEVEDNREQVALYALYVLRKHGVDREQIVARLEYLNEKTTRELVFSLADLEHVETLALASMEQMQRLLKDTDQNIPKGKEEFALTEAKDHCFWCNFYELCRDELERNRL